jgi:type IV pilus assembly protein PilY1
VGRAIFIADAETGARLWSAGAGGNLSVTGMDYSIPARVKPLDLSGDGYIDRLYVSDVGGQIFRFDIDNTNNALLTSSVTGGRIANLADTGITNARRFYYPPDVALVAEEGKTPYLGVAITSGFRAHPNLIDVHNRIYLLKDKDVYNTPSTYVTLTEADLYDATLNLVAAGEGTQAQNDAAKTAIDSNDGWFISLDDGTNTNTWVGEKGLSEVLILDGALIATTFIPDNSSGVTNSCTPRTGDGRTFFVDLFDGSAAYPSNTDTRTDRVTDLDKEGIPPSPNVIITEGGVPTLCIGTECSAANITSGVRKTYWHEVEK